MGVVFSNIDVDSMNFINNKHDLKFDFYTTTGNGSYCGSITCKGILSLELGTNFDPDEESPFRCFVCDVSVKKIESSVDVEQCFRKLNHGYSSMPESDEY